jgi:hypothetical protein
LRRGTSALPHARVLDALSHRGGAFSAAAPLTWIIPLVGMGTAVLFGAGVAFGVRAGARDIRIERRLTAG